MKLDFEISLKAATALAGLLALGALAAPMSAYAQDVKPVECKIKAATHANSMSEKTPTTTQVLTAMPVVPQPSSTVEQIAVNTDPASSKSLQIAPDLLHDNGEAGSSRQLLMKTAQLETVATKSKPNMQDPMTAATKPTPQAPDLWRNVLVNHTNQDSDGLVRFDYAGLKASPNDMAALTQYIDDLAAKTPSTFERNEAMAYWANLYNALTVRIVAENYPVKSIRKIRSGLLPGPWKKKLVEVEGNKLSLDNIEHDIMRPTYETPLVHYMVNCASIGCPNLKETPWTAETLDQDLEVAARAFINSPRGVTSDKGRLQVSSIYKWFQKDFGGSEQGVIEHLSQYANEDIAAKLLGRKKIDKFDYDWDINASQ